MVSKKLLDLLWLCNQLFPVFDGCDFICFGFYFGYILEKFGVSVPFTVPFDIGFFFPKTFFNCKGCVKVKLGSFLLVKEVVCMP